MWGGVLGGGAKRGGRSQTSTLKGKDKRLPCGAKIMELPLFFQGEKGTQVPGRPEQLELEVAHMRLWRVVPMHPCVHTRTHTRTHTSDEAPFCFTNSANSSGRKIALEPVQVQPPSGPVSSCRHGRFRLCRSTHHFPVKTLAPSHNTDQSNSLDICTGAKQWARFTLDPSILFLAFETLTERGRESTFMTP